MVPEIRAPRDTSDVRKRRRIALLVAGLAMAWAAGVALVAYNWFHDAIIFNSRAGWVDSRRLKLEPFVKPYPEDNGFALYQEAVDLVPSADPAGSGVAPADLVSDYTKGWVRFADVFPTLLAAQPAFEKVHEGAPKDYSSPAPLTIDADGPLRAQYRRLARFVAADVRAKHEQGRDTEALARARDGVAMGVNTAMNGPTIDKLVGIAMEAIVYRPTVTTVSSGDLSAAELRAHGAEIRRIHHRERPFRDVLRAEFEVWRDTARVLDQPGQRKAASAELHDRAFLLTWRPEAWLEWVEDRFARIIEESEKPRREVDLDAFGKRMAADMNARNDRLATIVMPPFAGFWGKCLQGEAALIGQETIPAIRAYEIEQGHLPDTLSDLAPEYLPEVPQDPFTGEPLRYRPEATGYVLYSVGRDKRDDGGTAGYVIGGSSEPDIILYPLPPLASPPRAGG